MAEVLSIENSNAGIVDQTYLAEDVVAGNTALPVANNDGILANMFAGIGGFGFETSELVGISAVESGSLTVDELLRDHAAQTAVLILQANQYKVYRAPNVTGTAPADGSFSLLGAVDIAMDAMQTQYVDLTGGAGFWYKVTQFNSLTAEETALADSTAVRGGSAGDYTTLADIREDAGVEDASKLGDGVVARYRRRAQAEVDSKLGQYFAMPFNPVPDAIREITTLLAAGWLLKKEYGVFEDDSNKNGADKLKEGRDWLTAIVTSAQGGTSNLPGVDLLAGSGNDVSGWPDDTTADADPYHGAGGDFAFRVGEDF